MNRKIWIEKQIEKLDIYVLYNDVMNDMNDFSKDIKLTEESKQVMSDIENYYYKTQLGNYRKIFDYVSINGFLRNKIHAVNCIFYKYHLNRYDFY